MRYKILLVDDDPQSMTLLKCLITPVFSTVEYLTANDGEEAYRLYEQNPDINLILTDIKMPIVNGINLLNQIKLHNPNIPIIAQSAFVYTKAEGMNMGFDDCILKPITRTELINSLKQFIASHK